MTKKLYTESQYEEYCKLWHELDVKDIELKWNQFIKKNNISEQARNQMKKRKIDEMSEKYKL